MRLVRSFALAGLFASATVVTARAESAPQHVVQNDGYVSGDATFRSGLVAGDIVAARLTAPDGGGISVLGVDLLFGGAGTGAPAQVVTVKVWDDSAETDEPGTELYTGEHTMSGDAAMQYIFLAGFGISGRFRVGVVLHADAPPMVAHDTDGTIAADDNLTFTTALGWHKSSADGVTGDWIIRARLVGVGVGGGGGGDGVFGSDDGDDGAGCCQSGGGSGSGGAVVLGLGVLAAVLRRRRRS